MLPEQRFQLIVQAVETRGLVRAVELANELGVSLETVRRDLLALDAEGQIRRVYGGAAKPSPRSSEPAYTVRAAQNQPGKTAIAALAATLVDDHDTLVLDVGTTVLELARILSPDFSGRVLTNSLYVALTVAERTKASVLVVGGELRRGDMVCHGPGTEDWFADLYADKAFLGSGGVHPKAGWTDFHLGEIPLKRTALEHSTETYVLADGNKFGRIALQTVAPLDRLTAIITDSSADPQKVQAVRESGATVHIAPVVHQVTAQPA